MRGKKTHKNDNQHSRWENFWLLSASLWNHTKMILKAKFRSEMYHFESSTNSDKISHTVREVLFSCLASLWWERDRANCPASLQSGSHFDPIPEVQGLSLISIVIYIAQLCKLGT